MAEPEETRKKEPWEQTIGEIFGTSTDADVGGAKNDGEKHPSGKNVRLTNHAEVAPVFATRIAEALSSTVLRVVGVSSNKPKSKPEDGGKDGDSIWRRMESWADEQKRDFDQFSWASVFDRSKNDGDRKNHSIQDSVSSQLGVRVDNLNESYSNADDEEERASYREEKSAKTWLNTFYNDIRTNKFFKPLDKIASGMASVVRGIASIGKGIMNLAAGIVNVFAHPIKTIKNIAATFIGAIGTVAGFLSSALPVILGIAAIGGTLFGIEKLTNVESRRGLLMRIGAKEEDGKYTSQGVEQENMDLFNMIVDDQGRMKSTSDIGFVGSMKILWKNFLFESSEFLIKKAIPFGKSAGEAFYDVIVNKLPDFVSKLWDAIVEARQRAADKKAFETDESYQKSGGFEAMAGLPGSPYRAEFSHGFWGLGGGMKGKPTGEDFIKFSNTVSRATAGSLNPMADRKLFLDTYVDARKGDRVAVVANSIALSKLREEALLRGLVQNVFTEGGELTRYNLAFNFLKESGKLGDRHIHNGYESLRKENIKFHDLYDEIQEAAKLEVMGPSTPPPPPPPPAPTPTTQNLGVNNNSAARDESTPVSVSRNPVNNWETATVEMGVRSVLSGGGFVPIA